MLQGPRDRCTALITDVVAAQAAMYTPTHNTHYSLINKPTHTTCTYSANNLHPTTHSHTLMPANLHFIAHAERP